MAFDTIESSNYDGKPVRLYEFQRGNTFMRYCTDGDYSVGGIDYEGCAISDQGVSITGDAGQDTFSVTLPTTSAIAQMFRGTPPSSPIIMRVKSTHRGDPDTEVQMVWLGYARSSTLQDAASAQIDCSTLLNSLDNNGLSLTWERGCPHVLYDRLCTIDPEAWRLDGSVTSLDGQSFTSAEAATQADGWWAGGYVKWLVDTDTYEIRAIESHVGTTITLLGMTDGITIGLAISLYPGCSHDVAGCQKFNNFPDNYGGCPAMPGVSPFDGNTVF